MNKEALGLEKIPEVTFMGLLVWGGVLRYCQGTSLSHERG